MAFNNAGWGSPANMPAGMTPSPTTLLPGATALPGAPTQPVSPGGMGSILIPQILQAVQQQWARQLMAASPPTAPAHPVPPPPPQQEATKKRSWDDTGAWWVNQEWKPDNTWREQDWRSSWQASDWKSSSSTSWGWGEESDKKEKKSKRSEKTSAKHQVSSIPTHQVRHHPRTRPTEGRGKRRHRP